MTKEYQILANDESSIAEINISPGHTLEQFRKDANLSVEEVATRLCLRVSVIEALEKDDYSNIKRHVFARGYLRAYARLLNINADEIINYFDNLNIKEIIYDKNLWQATKTIKKNGASIKWLMIVVIFFSIVITMSWRNAINSTQLTNSTVEMKSNKISKLNNASELVDIDSIDQETLQKGKH